MERNYVQCGSCPKIKSLSNSMYCTRCEVYLCLDCCERVGECSGPGKHILIGSEKGPVEKREMPRVEPVTKKSSCFIATAAYGSPLVPEVIRFRQFRDEVLLDSKIGKAFVGFYCFVSPPLASIIESTNAYKH